MTAQEPARPDERSSSEPMASLTESERQGRIVRDYLDALHAGHRRRGRAVEAVERRLVVIEEALVDADATRRSTLLQERCALLIDRDHLAASLDISFLENAFVAVAASYSERQRLSYQSWREVGVPGGVLCRAGVSRGR